MRITIILLSLILGIQTSTDAQTYKIKDDVKRVVFIGNSITYAGKYIEYIDTYMSIKYPNKNFEFINVGLPSETVSGLSEENHANGAFPRPDLHERLDRLLSKTKPDLVLSCYGMNDGIYLPYEDARFRKYEDGINWLHKKVVEYGSEIIHITPPIYDERVGEAYANVLDIYSDWLISKRYSDHWNVIDIHWPMRKKLEDHRLKDSTFVFANDGVHPNEGGHALIAKHILIYLEETELKNVDSFQNYFTTIHQGESVLSLVGQQQKIMKDAWLTSIGHQRPRMNVGLPMAEASQKHNEIADQINSLIKHD